MCTRRALHKLAYTLSSRMMMMNPKYAALMQSSNSNSSETCDEEWRERAGSDCTISPRFLSSDV